MLSVSPRSERCFFFQDHFQVTDFAAHDPRLFFPQNLNQSPTAALVFFEEFILEDVGASAAVNKLDDAFLFHVHFPSFPDELNDFR
jgi:hypothetical protein